MEISKENFLKLPQTPGVYLFYDKKKVIYVGKAINLKNRLSSYFQINLLLKTKNMVESSDSLKYIKVNSEIEALLLEAELIKKYKPKYNIVLKDDKSPLYIVITKEEFPRVLTVRKLFAINYSLLALFGPFPNSYQVKQILRIIRKIIPFSDHKLGKKPCLYSHLGLCNPCPNTIKMLNSKSQILNLTKHYTKNITRIKLILSRKFNSVRVALKKEMDNLSKAQKYEEAKLIRDKIRTLDYITQERIDSEKFLENPNLTEDIRNRELKSFLEILNSILQITNLVRIECYDISHLAGVKATASMVVAINGEMDNSFYRHFKIRQKKSQSDYHSMEELARRRINNFKKWGKPDLIIVDGGLGQVRVFAKSLKNYRIPVIGIAKNPDHLVFSNGKKVKIKGPALNLVQRLRDEAHRFARRLHHKLISKSLLDHKMTPNT